MGEEQFEDDNAFDEAFDSRVAETEGTEESDYLENESPENDVPEEEVSNKEEPTLEERIALVERERDELQHKYQSNNGRIQAYQRQVEELNHKVAQSVSSGDSREQSQESLAQDINGSSWDELMEDMPDVAQAIEARLQQEVQKSLSSFQQKIQPWEDRLNREAIDAEVAALKSRHPDFEQIRDSDDFSTWLDSQPTPVRQLTKSNNAADAAYLLDNFKRDNGLNESTGSNLKQRNRSRLKANIAPSSKRIARRDSGDEDFDMAFESRVRSKIRR